VRLNFELEIGVSSIGELRTIVDKGSIVTDSIVNRIEVVD